MFHLLRPHLPCRPNRILTLLGFGVFFASPLVFAPSALAQAGPLTSDDYPNSCYVIYPSQTAAQSQCPPNVKALEVYDFWGTKQLGWSCDCGVFPQTAPHAYWEIPLP